MGGGGARSALFGVAMSWKRRVRAAHGRARAAKNTSFIYWSILFFHSHSQTMLCVKNIHQEKERKIKSVRQKSREYPNRFDNIVKSCEYK